MKATRYGEHNHAKEPEMNTDGGEKLKYNITIKRPLAEQLVEHYHDNPEVRSVTDALREAGREIAGVRYESEGSE